MLHRLWGARAYRRAASRGASAVEYGLLLAGIAAVVAVAVYGVGRVSGDKMSNDCGAIGGQIQTALGTGSSTAQCQH